MSTDVQILKQLQNGYLQIGVKTGTNNEPKNYIVHKNFADKFQSDIKEHHKKMNTFANLSLGISAFWGVIGASFFTKRLNNKIAEIGANLLAALTLIGISGHFVSEYEAKKYKELLAKNQAREISFYS